MVIGDEIPLVWIYALLAILVIIGVYSVSPDAAITLAILFSGIYLASRFFEFEKRGEERTAVILLLFGLLFIGYGLSQLGVLKQTLFQGFTTLSISKAKFTSKDPFFNGKAWVVTIAPGGMAQHLYGTFTPEEIYEKSGKRPLKKFTLDITYHKQVAEYPIRIDYTSEPLYSLSYHEWTCFWTPSGSDAQAHCGYDWKYAGKYSGAPWDPVSHICFCIAEHKEASHMGYLDNPDVHWKVTFKLCIEGEGCVEKTFDSKNEISGKIGDIAYVTWDFSGIRRALPSKEPYKAIYRKGNWYLISTAKYNQYLSAYTSYKGFIKAHLISGSMDSSRRDTLYENIITVNEMVKNVLNTPVTFGDIINKGSVYSAYVEYPLKDIAQVPVFTLYIKADELGIYQPVPNVRIVDWSRSVQFKTGETGYAWVQIRNDGDERGTVDVWIAGCDPITMKGPTVTRIINPNSETIVYIPVISSAKTKFTKTCTIYVKERVTERLLTAKVSVTVSPQQICTPGVKRCSPLEPGLIEICNSEGTGWIEYRRCPSGYTCTYESGQPVCKKSGPQPPQPPVCGNGICEPGETPENCPQDCGQPTKECPNCFAWLRGKLAKLIGGEAVTMCKPKEISITVFGFKIFAISQDIYCPIFILAIIAIVILVLIYFRPIFDMILYIINSIIEKIKSISKRR